ncbi:MAG: AEC family transporter [Clostridia bacterium]|nr:AEC family transporter [Clostridia bacterium]
MLEVFSFSFNAVAPILLLAVAGYIIKLTKLFDDSFFKKCNTMVFKVFLPILLFKNVYDIKSISEINVSALFYCVAVILILCLIGYLSAKLFSQHRAQKGVINQCTFRSNYAIIGIPLAESLGSAQALAFAGVLSAVSIPLFNVLAVMILSHYSDKNTNPDIKSTLKSAAKNPLIRGVGLGIIVLIIRSFIPLDEAGQLVFSVKNDLPFIYEAVSNLAKVASPLALVVLGARFDFAAVKSLIKPISSAVVLRLVVAPLVGVGGAVLLDILGVLDFTATEYPGIIALFSTPVAVSSAVMVSEIGGDEQLAGQLVVWTSILSVFSMFAVVFIMKSAAFI